MNDILDKLGSGASFKRSPARSWRSYALPAAKSFSLILSSVLALERCSSDTPRR